MSATDVVRSYLASAGIPHSEAGEGRWGAQLAGERKRTIPVSLAIAGETLVIESFFMRRPQENAERFYATLLRRNARAYGMAFALDAVGDVYLIGRFDARTVDEPELDRIFGSILVEADGSFDEAIAIGFESYLARDLAWRRKAAEPSA
ncbi:MAG TPA: YbjN domain-containing protein [Actinomycetota bacterium]